MRKMKLFNKIALLTSSLYSINMAEAATINITPGTTHTINAAGTISDDFDFLGGNGILEIDTNGDTVFTGQLLNSGNGTIRVFPGVSNRMTFATNQTNISAANLDAPDSDFILEINNPTQATTTLDLSYTSNTCCWGFAFLTPTIVNHSSIDIAIARDGYGFIGSPAGASSLVLQAEQGFDMSFINMSHPDSVLTIDNSNVSADTSYVLGTVVGGQVVQPGVFGGPQPAVDTDLSGTIKLNANNHKLTISGNGIGDSFGKSSTFRLGLLEILGNKITQIDTNTFAKDINFNSTGNVNFGRDIDLGTNGKMTFMKDTDLGIQGTPLAAVSPTIILGDKNLNITQGTAAWSGDVTIQTSVNITNFNVGHITTNKGVSTLDMSSANSLTVNMEGASPVLDDKKEYSQLLISDSFSNIGDLTKVTFNDNEQNPLIQWSYDPSTTKMTSTTTPANLVNIVQSSPNTNNAAVTMAKEIVKEVEKGNGKALEVLNALTSSDADKVVSALSVPERVQALIPQETAKNLTEEAESTGTAAVLKRANEVAALKDNINFTEEFGIGVAAGDDAVTKFGIWASPFYQIATQKKFDADPGYKVWNYGATIGADTMVSDNITMGLAFSHVRSKMKQFDVKLGSKTRTYTNMVSLYGLMDLDNDYFISGIGSYGISRINSRDIRQVGNAIPRTAHAKYKTHIISGQLTGSRRFRVNNTRLIPSIGLRYANFIDDAYSETNAGSLNLNLSRKSSCTIEGILGIKAIKEYIVGEYKLEPEIFGGANINLRNKKPVTYISNQGFNNPVKLEGEKPSKAWYYLGGGLNSTKDNLEVSLNYEAQLDKQYIGHQGICRIRLNF